MAASWILVPCLVKLRNEFNELAPARDKASDGSIGDTPHAAGASDHNPDETGNVDTHDADRINEVHAIDVDDDLDRPGRMQQCVDLIVGNHRAGVDNRLQNVIYNRRIASASWGWTWRDYTGASPHTEHAHFSATYITAREASTKPWGLLTLIEEELPVKQSEFNALMNGWAKSAGGAEVIADAVLHMPVGNEAYPGRDLADFANDLWPVRDDYVGDGKGAAVNPPKAGSLGALMKSLVVAASAPEPASAKTAAVKKTT